MLHASDPVKPFNLRAIVTTAAMTGQQFRSCVDSTHTFLSDLEATMQRLSPQGQCNQFGQILTAKALLENCKELVKKVYDKIIVDEEWNEVTEPKVIEAEEFIKLIEKNYTISKMISEAEEAFSINPDAREFLFTHVAELISEGGINWGNTEAARFLLGRISSDSRPSTPVPAPMKRSPALHLMPAVHLLFSDSTPSTPIPAPMKRSSALNPMAAVHLSPSEIPGEEEESEKICEFMNEYTLICKGLQKVIHEDFQSLLTFYVRLKEYLDCTQFILYDHKALAGFLLDKAKKRLNKLIQQQKQIETEIEQDQKDRAVLPLLATALDKAEMKARKPDCNYDAIGKEVEIVFAKLSLTKKRALFDRLDIVLKNEGILKGRDLPINLLKQSFFVWSNSYTYRLEAVKQLVASSLPLPFTQLGLFDQMSQLMAEASETPVPIPLAHQIHASSEISLSLAFLLKNIKLLQTLLSFLGDDSSTNQLEEMMVLWVLEIEEPTKERIHYHLDWIHKNENPQEIKIDDHYGKKVMNGHLPTFNSERRRAICRTIIEFILVGLKKSLETTDTGTWIDLKKTLINLPHDEKDLPQGLLNEFLWNTATHVGGSLEAVKILNTLLKKLWKEG